MSFKALESLGEHGSRLIGSIVKITAFGLGIDQNQANKVCCCRDWLGTALLFCAGIGRTDRC